MIPRAEVQNGLFELCMPGLFYAELNFPYNFFFFFCSGELDRPTVSRRAHKYRGIMNDSRSSGSTPVFDFGARDRQTENDIMATR
jgi:hypothetical protein